MDLDPGFQSRSISFPERYKSNTSAQLKFPKTTALPWPLWRFAVRLHEGNHSLVGKRAAGLCILKLPFVDHSLCLLITCLYFFFHSMSSVINNFPEK